MSQCNNNRTNRPEKPAVDTESAIIFLPTDHIRPNRAQPRKRFDTNTMIRLADSVRRYGILQPLTVRAIASGEGAEVISDKNAQMYELIAGERRLRAAKLAGLTCVPCILATADDHLSAELAVIENLLREDLDMFEQARAFGRLILQFSMTQEQVARKMSMSQSAVANKLRLLRLTESEQRAILAGGLTERHARALLRLPSSEAREGAILYMVEHRMNVATAEAYIDSLLSQSGANNGLAEQMPGTTSEKEPGTSIIAQNTSEVLETGCRGKKKLVLQDLRVFYNSLERAVGILKQTGLSSRMEELRHEDCVEIRIFVEQSSSDTD